MNSRERVLASIRHQEPDRVPVDLGSNPSSGISAIAYNNLKNHLEISEGNTRIYDVVQQLAQPENIVLDRFGVDVVDIGRTFNKEDNDWYDITLSDGGRGQYPAWFHPKLQDDGSWNAYAEDGTLIAKMPVGATFFDGTCFPYEKDFPANYKNLPEDMEKVLWAALVHSPWDHASDPDFWIKLRERTLKLRAETDRALMIVCGCNLFEWGTFLRGMGNFLLDIAAHQTEVEGLLDALMEQHLATLEKVCESVGDIVDIIRFGDDLGMNNGPFMHPDTYRKLFKPRHTILCDYVKKNSNMNTFLHSCGSIYKLVPDLIEAGYDILNPVQTDTVDMSAEKLKKEFGKDVTFWGGGVDTRKILNNGTPDEVKKDVLERLEIFAPGGGFVFNSIHNIMPDVPPENIVAMFEAIDTFYE